MKRCISYLGLFFYISVLFAAEPSKPSLKVPLFLLWFQAQNGNSDIFLSDSPILPPDILSIPQEPEMAVSVSYDKAQYELAYDGFYRRSIFPLFWESKFNTIRVKRNEAGLPVRIDLPDEKITIVVTEYLDNGPLRCQYKKDGENLFVLLRYWESGVEESWYTETGELETLYEYHFSQGNLGQISSISQDGSVVPITIMDYDAHNLVSSVTNGQSKFEFLYDGKNRIRLVREIAAEGSLSERNFQYDERGLLVRQYGRLKMENFEYRYKYSFDQRGFWTSCTVQAWNEQFGRLIPSTEIQINRTITRR
ncbi:hypothetical protein [Gracilinema caldarium]|uniref:hypothetical protein n=1 Tax=Gracilinema caldarium TaxID=215591 RepID=UPI0026EFD98D|nr:hypothetical protein [Gracilinema caldarium]